MAKTIQLRHVPDSLHRKLKARAAKQKLTLSDYLVRIVTEIAETPTDEELRQRAAKLSPVHVRIPAAQIIREERDHR